MTRSPTQGIARGKPLVDRPLILVQAAACAFPSPQGSQVYVQGMAGALARRGHDVTVACYGHGQGPKKGGYRVVRTPNPPGYRRLRAGPDLVKPALDLALAGRLAGLSADVVHAHNYEAPIAAALARLRTRAPLVYSAHNMMAEELPTYLSSRVAQGAGRVAGRLLDRAVPRLADHAVAINPRAVPMLEALGCPRVSLVPPGVDPEDVAPCRAADLPAGPWVVYAGNPDRYQDLDVLLEAMAHLPHARLLLVSASPLSELARTAPPGTRCVETQDFGTVRRLLAAAQVAALPRTVCSGFPIKLLNYLGMGLPVVAAEGSAQALPGVVTVPNGDPLAMAAALADLLRQHRRRQALSAQARQHVLTACSWDARARQLEAVYDTVIGLRSRLRASDRRQGL